ncbi:hypothetical protein D2V17_03110 [Aurantiacibacter xanthus]|uniref:DUF8021 domain-containing protein n=1 Tax=Aurantiacibacter xanthus TaxID=1784712 RepID=A0A3A1PCD5_9SPHN|nr:hypothetical protein [Aurantiacibacter xanthus]RIV91426.1 hypothetical protein D2V17_03110 [Aurantiacibacter xanthus]
MKYHLLAAIALALPMAAHAQAPGEESALRTVQCDYACLTGTMQQFVDALAAGDASALPLSSDLLYTENNVPLALGEGSWRTTHEVDDNGLLVADETTGHAAWFGSIRENDIASFYAVRIHVSGGLIDEAEAVIHRKSGLPAPYGDWQGMEHFAEFAQILPEEERRPRERMLAIADAYFDTVELNDGQVFAPFSEDCARLENGILTTAPIPGQQQSAAAIAAGCRAQFELGIYRINKRIRRHLPLVDEQRGVVVGAGFFDHANEFDRYLLTNGSEMKTALKWPNSITLLEAFRIRDGEIQRIEATFTYVPYFMHNPFWGDEAKFPLYAPRPAECDNHCLTANASALVSAMAGNRWQGLNWSERPVGYAENSVGIRIGESVWRTITSVDPTPLIVADAETGKAVWIGRIEEHGQPAWAAITMLSDGDAIGGADVLVRRKEYGAPYAEPVSAPQFAPLPQAGRTSRADMAAGMHAFFSALAGNGPAPDLFADDCRWLVNGQDVGTCPTPFGSPALAGIERVRDIELLAMDEARGLAVYRQYEDRPATDGSGYPLTYQVIEMARFDGGRIVRIEAFTSELPYGMRPIQHR